jgi:hypothetical protein
VHLLLLVVAVTPLRLSAAGPAAAAAAGIITATDAVICTGGLNTTNIAADTGQSGVSI